MAQGCEQAGVNAKLGGTYVCMEGPQFSTKAESQSLSQLGNGRDRHDEPQEAKLAREAELCYATVAMVTDYDCWHPEHDARDRRPDYRRAQTRTPRTPATWCGKPWRQCRSERGCKCGSALAMAIITARDAIPAQTRERLKLIIGKYVATTVNKKAGA